MKRIAATLFHFVLLSAASTALFAHNADDHAMPNPSTTKKEQKPWGIAGKPKAVKRTINIAMTDNMRFVPDKVDVKTGQTIRFVLKNEGKMLHEMVIGTRKVLNEHAALMLKFPDMEHAEPYMVHVPAGETREIIWKFNRAGNFEYACLIAGHFQAGMRGTIKVSGS